MSLSNVLTWAQTIDKQHGIIVVIVRSDTANEMRGKRDKWIMDCERGENYKRNNTSEINISLEDIYSMKVKCSFRLRYVSSFGR